MFDSILWLTESKTRRIDPRVIKDLNLNKIYEKLIDMSEDNEAIIHNLCMDLETIAFRQDILADFMAYPNFILDLEKDLEGFKELRTRVTKPVNTNSKLYHLVDLVVIVETSVQCLEALGQTFKYYKHASKGLMKLQASIQKLLENQKYKQMKQDIKKIRYIFSQIKSVEVSINMAEGMRPYEAQVTEVNRYKYRFPKAFRKVSAAINYNDQFLGKRLKNYAPIFPVSKMDWDLLDEIEYALKQNKPILKSFLERYERIDTTPFLLLLQEITFYKSSCDILRDLRDNGLAICKPKLIEREKRSFNLKDCYNISLAYDYLSERKKKKKAIVYNDFSMGEQGRIIILTGANRGGKTTITQAIGQIQLFAQLGLLVPAKEAELSIVDGVYTHFPLLEKETLDFGKFGKECQLFSQIFHKATEYSLILLNESFSGTSHLESLKIAEEVVKATKHKRIRMVYNTHLHELSVLVSKFNAELNNDTNIVSLVTGFEEGENNFKVYIGEPPGISHAREIAKKYQVTFEQLLSRMEGGN